MGRSHDIATSTHGDTRYANVSGDTFTGAVNVDGGNISLNPSNEAAHRYLFLNAGTTNDGHIVFQRGGSPKFQLSSDTNGHLFTWNYAKNGTSFRINVDGSVITPHQPGWHGTHADNYNSPYSAGQAHNMDASLEKYNVGNHFNYSNNRFTCPVTGYYLFYGWDIAHNVSSVYNSGNAIGCWKNSFSNANRLINVYRQYNRGYSFTGTAYLAANDYVTFGNSEGSIGAGAYYGSTSYSGYGIRLLS